MIENIFRYYLKRIYIQSAVSFFQLLHHRNIVTSKHGTPMQVNTYMVTACVWWPLPTNVLFFPYAWCKILGDIVSRQARESYLPSHVTSVWTFLQLCKKKCLLLWSCVCTSPRYIYPTMNSSFYIIWEFFWHFHQSLCYCVLFFRSQIWLRR